MNLRPEKNTPPHTHYSMRIRAPAVAIAVLGSLTAVSAGISSFTPVTIQHDGLSRHAWVYVPDSAKTGTAAGVVFFFHGLSVSIDKTCGGAHLSSFSVIEQANNHNFIAACPQGCLAGDSVTPGPTTGGQRG